MSVELKLLPPRALFDTSVFIKAFNKTDPDHRVCRDLYEAMKTLPRSILWSTLSIAEILRGEPRRKIPRTPGIIIVPFDYDSATILGRKFPADTLKQWREAGPGAPLDYYKFDAMILAIALRHDVPLVTTDGPQGKRAKAVGVLAKHPTDYQPQLPLLAPTPIPPAPKT